jgi:hypothetical protein
MVITVPGPAVPISRSNSVADVTTVPVPVAVTGREPLKRGPTAVGRQFDGRAGGRAGPMGLKSSLGSVSVSS